MDLPAALECPSERLDLSGMEGVSMAVDETAEEAFVRLLAPWGYRGIHFLDNGNYHYVTRFFLRKIVSPFCLVVFDHHDDEQPPAFGTLRSCASWIRDAKEEFAGTMKSVLTVRSCVPGEEWSTGELIEGLPVYCSVDKDILSREACPVNWDQGETSLEDLLQGIRKVLGGRELLGADICGAPLPDSSGEKETAGAFWANRFVDVSLYRVFEEYLINRHPED